MARLSHGSAVFLDEQDNAIEDDHEMGAVNPNLVPCPEPSAFDYLFPELQGDEHLLPPEPDMAERLIALGNSMGEPLQNGVPDPGFDSTIPSAYTYLGQFITHDISLDGVTKKIPVNNDSLPLTESEIKATLKNGRTAKLDLDSVYGPIIDPTGCSLVPRKDEEFLVARAYPSRIDGTDLPRNSDKTCSARIGDPRNDENLITSQLHLAFLRAHNNLVRRGNSFADAQRLLRYHYQWLVTHDFLDNIADRTVVEEVRNGKTKVYPSDRGIFMPLEFSVAAFRFGHSMVRSGYNYNASFKHATLEQLILPGALGNYFQILQDWIISWKNFVEGPNFARRIDTRLVDPLSRLLDRAGTPLPGLAALDLVRGYILRLPTGQAVAKKLGLPTMSKADFEKVAANEEQMQILQSGLVNHTPLWFYILAEAARFQEGQRLGPVGSTLVAGVLIGLVRESNDSYMRDPDFSPTLGQNGGFDLADLFQLADVSN